MEHCAWTVWFRQLQRRNHHDLACKSLQNRGFSLYLRKRFTVTPTQAASASILELLARYNDGFVAFINEVEVARRNLGNPGAFVFHDQATFSATSNTAPTETISLGAANTRLVAGENILCVQVHNKSLTGTEAANLLFLGNLRISGGATLVTNTETWKYFLELVEPSGGVLDYGLFNKFVTDQSGVARASRAFNDSAWLVGSGPLGLEDASPPDYSLGINLYSEMFGLASSVYSRRVFTNSATEVATTNSLRLTIDYDDGIIVYLNGKEAVRRNVGTTGTPTAGRDSATATV